MGVGSVINPAYNSAPVNDECQAIRESGLCDFWAECNYSPDSILLELQEITIISHDPVGQQEENGYFQYHTI